MRGGDFNCLSQQQHSRILNSMKFRVPASFASHMAEVPLSNSGRDTGRFTNSGAA
ncbi:hypothetical protein DPMN_055681 [Dreissena polymorpha]|uniref:Uncharacterized protein n=1 Tax=Dreissena polymorpha TaxID=45954 RepID=A0A9D4HUB1_DREPO|nr:hypothetical protein DPMN_055681 [Dreissena polymorpha]